MKDKIIRGISEDGYIRFFGAVTTNLVEKARVIHNCSPVSIAALGRVLTASSIMGVMLKNDKDKLTVQINGGGEAGAITVVSNSKGIVKGYITNPNVERALNSRGKLDVGGAVGKNGNLIVIKDLGLKEPYVGQVPLVSGEIAEDFTYYFAISEQVPSAVSLGVLVDTDRTVISAGGFIIQLMPDAPEHIRDIIEYRLDEIPPVTKSIYENGNINSIIDELLDGMNMKVYQEYDIDFSCECSKYKIEKVLISLGANELNRLKKEQEITEVCCDFCNKKYIFTSKDIDNLLKTASV